MAEHQAHAGPGPPPEAAGQRPARPTQHPPNMFRSCSMSMAPSRVSCLALRASTSWSAYLSIWGQSCRDVGVGWGGGRVCACLGVCAFVRAPVRVHALACACVHASAEGRVAAGCTGGGRPGSGAARAFASRRLCSGQHERAGTRCSKCQADVLSLRQGRVWGGQLQAGGQTSWWVGGEAGRERWIGNTRTRKSSTSQPEMSTLNFSALACTSAGRPSSVTRASPFFTTSEAAASTRRSADCGGGVHACVCVSMWYRAGV